MARASSAHAVSHFHLLTMPALIPFLPARYGVGFVEIAFAMTVFSLVSLLVHIPLGFMTDRIGPRPMLVAGLWAWDDPGEAGALLPSQSEAVGEPRTEGTDLGLSGAERAQFSASISTRCCICRFTISLTSSRVSGVNMITSSMRFRNSTRKNCLRYGVKSGSASSS